MQVSNATPRKVNGKVHLSQPVRGYVAGSLVAAQTARNPVRVLYPLDLNVTMSVLVLVMMVHDSDICPQCLET